MRTGLVAAALLAGVTTMTGCTRSPTRPERVVLVVVDTLRRDVLPVYGGTASTPTIDRLANNGVVFGAATGSFHQTTMSMGAMFTGLTPSIESADPAAPNAWIEPNWCGLGRFATTDAEACIPGQVGTIGELMKAAGYWTAGAVGNRLLFRPAGFDRGFDDWVEVGGATDADKPLTFRESVKARAGGPVNHAVRQLLDRRPNDRFFLYVHYMDVHDWYLGVPTKDVAEKRHHYAAAVELQDAFLGELIAELESLDLLDGTVVVLTGDHGEAFGEAHFQEATDLHYGNPSFEPVLNVPLVVSGWDVEDAGTPVRSEDVFRLLAKLVGAPERTSSDLGPRELFLSEQAYQVYSDGRWKSYVRRSDGHHALVDLHADPGETKNVADLHPETIARHRKRMKELGANLSVSRAGSRELNQRETEALRALGYLDEATKDEP